MLKKEVIVRNSSGLKSRPAAMFIQKASNYKSSIFVETTQQRRANAKSLLGLLSLGIADGSTITLVADGEDEEVAVNDLNEYLNTRFEEDF